LYLTKVASENTAP